MSAAPNAGYNFYGWFGPPYPQGGDPYPFLIQSPEPTLQGVFTTFPVTTIGESITGPNTWDPPLYATVDSDNYTYLPQGYSQDQSGSAWAPGTSHTISAPSPDVPVTTNVSYSWNNWSDSGAQTHNITASSTRCGEHYRVVYPGLSQLCPDGERLRDRTIFSILPRRRLQFPGRDTAYHDRHSHHRQRHDLFRLDWRSLGHN